MLYSNVLSVVNMYLDYLKFNTARVYILSSYKIVFTIQIHYTSLSYK